MPERPRYMISVAADLVGMHPQTLRMYEAKGLVHPGRTPGGTRLYSDHDVERLRLIQRLTTELGLNLAGVEHVLRLQDELNRTRARMNRLERELRAEIAEVHRSYRRDVVLYRPAKHPAKAPTSAPVPARLGHSKSNDGPRCASNETPLCATTSCAVVGSPAE